MFNYPKYLDENQDQHINLFKIQTLILYSNHQSYIFVLTPFIIE